MSHARSFRIRIAIAAVAALLLACDADRLVEPTPPVEPEEPPHPELVRYALALHVDVVTARVTLGTGLDGDTAGAGAGPSFSLVGNAEIATTVGNVTRGNPVNGRVSLTFDVALTSLLNSGNLVTPTFPLPPAGVQGLLLIPFQIRDKQGPGTVREGPEWDGPNHNFFNDFNCTATSGGNDCYPYETFASPLAPGATTAAQTVGFDIDSRVRSFTVLMILAADIENTPPPPPGAGAIAGRVVSPLAGALAGVAVTAGAQAPVTTDIAGGYQLTGVPLGDVSVALSGLPQGCTDPGPRTATVLSGGIATVEFSVTCPAPPATTGTVAGTVTSPTLGNLYGVIAAVNPANRGAATDGAGAYAVPGVPAGEITVTLSNLPSGCVNPGAQAATVVAGGSVPVNFSVSCDGQPTTGTLTGTLNSAAGPLGGVTVTLQPGNLTTASDAAGVFTFGNLTPGTVLVTFDGLPAGCTNPGTQAAEIVGGRGAVLNLLVNCGGVGGVGAIRGTVSGQLGTPFASVGVRVVATGATLTGTTGNLGDYLIQGVSAGQIEVSLDPATLRNGCTAPPAQSLTLGAGLFATVDFTVQCLTGVEGQVVSFSPDVPLGNLADVDVELIPAGSTTPIATVRLGTAPSAFRFLVPNGHYVLQIAPATLPAHCASVAAIPISVSSFLGTMNVEVACASPGWLVGRVYTDTPVTLGPQTGAVHSPSRLFGPTPIATFTTGAFGNYAVPLPGLSAGATMEVRSNAPAECRVPGVGTGTWDPAGTRVDVRVDCGQGTITGTLTTTAGAPVAGIRIESLRVIGAIGTFEGEATTAADGSYTITTFTGVSHVQLGFFPDGCTPADAGIFVVTVPLGGSVRQDFQVTCASPGSISGAAVDLDGAPVADAAITATDGEQSGTATSGPDGGYLIPGLAAGDYTLRLEKADACDPLDAGPVTVIAGETATLDLSVNCPPFATGTLTAAQGTLPRELEIAVIPRGGERFQVAPAADGTYRVPLAIGAYDLALLFLPAGCTANTHSIETTRQQQHFVLDFAVDCAVPGSIVGHVRDRDAQPVADARVILAGVEPAASVVTGPDGRYEISRLPGTYQVTVEKSPACVTLTGTELSVTSGQVTGGDLTIDCPPVASGTVTIGQGLTFSDGQFQAVFTPGAATPLSAPVAADGSYRVTLDAADYSVTITGFNSASCLTSTQSTGPTRQQQVLVLDFAINCASITGTVVDLTGQPVAGARVQVGILIPLPAPLPPQVLAFASAGTGADGRYGMVMVAGSWGMLVETLFGCSWASAGVTVVIGQETSASFTLDCPTVATGTVTMSQGALPAGLQVVFTPGQAGPPLTATVGSDGTWAATLGIDEYIVTLQGLPALCGIESQSSQSVDAIGQQRNFVVNFIVRCEGLTVTPAVYDYGEVGVDAPEAATFTLTNTSSTAIGFDDSEWSGDQADFIGGASTTCNFSNLSAAIPAGASCTLTLIFSPTALGSRSATFTLTPSSGGTIAISLVGVGVVGGSMLTFTPSSFDWGAVEVGAQGAPMTFTLTNTGPVPTGPLTGEFAGATGDFVPLGGGLGDPRSTCVGALGSGVPPGLSCTVTFQFVPQGSGPRSLQFIARGQPGGTASLALSGTGVTTNSLTLTPSPLDYGSVALGSARQLSFLLTNTGSVTTGQLGGVGFNGPNAGDFNLVAGTTCGGLGLPVLGPGGSCVIAIEFRPLALGDRTASFTIGATPGGTALADLAGAGVTTLLAFSPASHDFGSFAVGNVSPTVRFTLTNTAPEPSGGFVVQTSGEQNDFPAIGTDCQLSGLAPGASCFMDFQFAPLANGARSFTQTFGSAAAGAVSLTLSGTGTGGFSTDGAIDGFVRDLDGQPVAGALVTSGSSQFTTAADGRYTLPDLAPGSHSVTAVKSGFCIDNVQTVPVTSGQTTSFDFALDCQGQVRGHVIPAAGTVPPTGMEVEFTDLSTSLVAATAFVFPDLQYGPIGLPNGSYAYRLIAQDCGTIGGAVTVTQQSERLVDVPVECLTTIAGSLSSPTRTPDAFAFQTVFVGGNATTTDENGGFSVSNVAPGTHTIEVVLEVLGCVPPEPFEVTAIQSRTVRADVVLDCPGTGVVQGVVRDLDGAPVAGAVVSLVNGADDQSTITDAEGNYEIGQALAIDATVRVIGGGLCLPSPPAALTVQAGVNNALDLTANCPGILTGLVTSSSTGPLAGITVGVMESGPGGTTWLPVTDVTGTYRIQGDGSFLVFIPLGLLPAGCTQPPSQPAVVRQQGQVTVNIPLTCP